MSMISKNALMMLIQDSSEGMIITDENNVVVLINNAGKNLMNLEQNQIFNSSFIFGEVVSDSAETISINYANKRLLLRRKQISTNQESLHIYFLSEIRNTENEYEELIYLRTIMDYINEGVIATNQEGNIVVYNKQLAEFEELNKNQVAGKNLTDIYDVTLDTSDHMMILKSKNPIKDLNRKYFTKSGHFIQLIASTYPVIKNDQVVGAFSISRNVTKIRELFSKIMESQQKLPAANNRPNNGTRFSFDDIIGKSAVMQSLIKEAKKAALTPSPILIGGETGTGKELFVQSIHNWSMFREQPFVGINCAAIPEALLESLLFGTVKGAYTGAENSSGLFEQAECGTLYLDEINSLPLTLQAKLLRAIQEKTVRRIGGHKEIPVNCRIISSTNEDLLQSVNKGSFRKDLYYRIAVIVLTLPPLRERSEDIKLLADYFIQKYARIYGKTSLRLSDVLLKFITQYAWPGNIREMEHVFESSLAMLEEDDELTINHLPLYLRAKIETANIDSFTNGIQAQLLGKILREVEKKVILEALEKYNWNITRAGHSIGIGRQNMQYRMSKLGIRHSPSFPIPEDPLP